MFRRQREQTDYHLTVLPSGLGATFHVRRGRREPEITWSYDPGVLETVRETRTMERAAVELGVALGHTTDDLAAVRPVWMGSFIWAPPLPERLTD